MEALGVITLPFSFKKSLVLSLLRQRVWNPGFSRPNADLFRDVANAAAIAAPVVYIRNNFCRTFSQVLALQRKL